LKIPARQGGIYALAEDVSSPFQAEPAQGDYTAFEKWDYDKIFYAESSPKSWLDIGESFYTASLHLIEGVADDRLSEDTEGIAAAFLFRH
jgi:hypothetical protein